MVSGVNQQLEDARNVHCHHDGEPEPKGIKLYHYLCLSSNCDRKP